MVEERVTKALGVERVYFLLYNLFYRLVFREDEIFYAVLIATAVAKYMLQSSKVLLHLLQTNFFNLFYIIDTTIRGGLYHEFKKHGDVGQIKVFGRDSSRHAIVYFRR